MKKTKMKALSTLLAAAVMLVPAVQPAAALAKPEAQNMMMISAMGSKDLPSQAGEENGQKPPSVTDAVYGQDSGAPPNGPLDDEAGLNAASAFSGTNLALHKPVFASGNEVDYLNPELAVDGKGNTRWSSALQDDQWFYVDLGEPQEIDRVVIRWQTPADSYKILVSVDGESWENVKENDGIITCKGGVETIDFSVRQARYVKFQGVKRAPVEGTLYGYSFYEFEVYQLHDLQTIIDNVSAALTVQPGQTKLDWSAAGVPKGYQVSLYGSDRQPAIDLDGQIRTPLVDAKVNLIVQVEDEKDPNRSLLSGSIPVVVPGLHKQTPDRNAEPDVIPSLQEWYGDTGRFTLKKSSRIVVNPQDESALRNAAELTREDLLDVTGYDLKVVTGKPKAGDLYLSIDPSLTRLGEEGNRFKVGDYVSIASVSAKGTFYGTRTALQIIKQHPDRTIPKGEAMDYPKYAQRGLMIDVARKFYTIDFLRSYVKLLS